MTIKEVYKKFNDIGCLTFATVDKEGNPQTRIAHLRAYDEEGLYFMTMHTKDFYKELKETSKVSICGLNANSKVTHDKDGMPMFDKGYSIRLTGVVEEVTLDMIKTKNNPDFDLCIKDQGKYNAMVIFCIKSYYGDIFDYDFEKEKRDHKLERVYFSHNQEEKYKGLIINQEKCIKCGLCQKKCSFDAITNIDNKYSIDKNRCDECGDCYINCPVKAIKKG